MKKAVVILGAGASYDVDNGTVPVTNEKWRPPLAAQLFEERFWEIKRVYPGAEVLGSELGRLALVTKNGFDLEAQLTRYATSPDRRTQRHFKDIPAYLRDVLTAVTDAYVPSPTSYIHLTKRLLHDETHEVMFVVLNYDTLLERALEKYDEDSVIRGLSDYIESRRQAKIVKIHGSTNWGAPMSGLGNDWRLALNVFDPRTVPDTEIVFSNAGGSTLNWRGGHENDLLFPRLTAPVTDKTFVCPSSHEGALQDFLADCHKFLIIGTSGLDDDLLDTSAKVCTGNGYILRYVNQGRQATAGIQARFEAKIPAFSLRGPSNPTPKLFENGFTEYLDRPDIEEFLAAD